MAKTTSEKQVRANRQNAKKSTGPKTEAGKKASSRNAVKHGATGKGENALGAMAREMTRRADEWTSVMKPAEGPEAWFVARAAKLSARLDAAVRVETQRCERLRHEMERATTAETAFPSPADAIDLSEECDRLRQYEVSLDRQLHSALRRARLLRRERVGSLVNPSDGPPRNEPISTTTPPAPIAPSPLEKVADRPDEGPGFESHQNPLIRRYAAPSPEGEGGDCSLLPVREDGRRPEGLLHLEPIPPRRSRPVGNGQATARVMQEGPPLRGRIPGKEQDVGEGRRGGYCSPEVRKEHSPGSGIHPSAQRETPYRDKFPRSRAGLSVKGLLLHGNGRSPIVERPDERGGRGEPGGTRAMGACEPGQGGNAAAISIASMCPGAPPRLSPAPAASPDLDPRTDGA